MKVKFGIKVMKLVESLIGLDVTVGQGSEYHLTFVRLETTRNSAKVNISNKVMKLVKDLIGWGLVTVTDQGVRMLFNIQESETSYCQIRSPH